MKTYLRLRLLTLLLCISTVGALAQVRPVFEERFDDLSAGIPSGWNNDRTTGDVRWGYNRDGKDGTGCMYYRNMVGSDFAENMLVVPTMKTDGDMMLSFDHKVVGNKGVLLVFLSFDGGGTFEETPLLSIEGVNGLTEWDNMQAKLPVSPTGDITVGFVARRVTTGYTSPIISLDNVVIDHAPKCAAPVNLSINAMTENSVELIWGYSDMGSASEKVDVLLMKDGNVLKESTETLSDDGILIIGGLQANAAYSVKVRTNCEASYFGRSEWSDELKFSTLCAPEKPDLKYDFDSDTEVSSCWIIRRDNTTMTKTVALSSVVKYGTSGKSLEIPKGTVGKGNTYVFTGLVDHAADDLEISLMAYNNNETNDEMLEIGIQGDVYAAGTYCKLKEVALPPKEWTHIVVYTDGVLLGAQTGASVVLWAKDLEKQSIFIDDIEINEMPPCRVPTDVRMTAVGSSFAEFDWNVESAGELEVFDVTEGKETSLGMLTAANRKLTLTENTVYTLRFRNVCTGGEKSNWGTETITLRTPCVAKTVPYTVDFEDGQMPDCWNNDGMTRLSDGKHFEWLVADVSNDAALSQGGENKYTLRSPKSGAATVAPRVNIVLPYTDIPAAGEYMVEFYIYHATVADSEKDCVNVYINKNRPDTIGAIFIGTTARKSATMGTGWERMQCLIPEQGDMYIIFEMVTAKNCMTDLDNVKVAPKSTCLSPWDLKLADVGATSATMKWTERSIAKEYIVTYKLKNQTMVDTVRGTNRYTIEGLTPITNYGWLEFAVKGVCAEGDTSDVMKDRFSLTTGCGVTEIPYTRPVSGSDWKCYTVLESVGNYPMGSSSIQLRGYSNIFALPEFDYTSAAGHRVKFSYWTLDDGSILEVGTITDAANYKGFKVIGTITGTSQSQPFTVEIKNTTDKYIAFRYTGKTEIKMSYINGIVVEPIPDCPDIQSVQTVEVSAHTARIAVTCPGVSSFEVEYGKKGFTRGSGTTVMVESDFTLSALDSDTDYDLYVRSACDGGKTGVWYPSVHTFTTFCDAKEITVDEPFFSGFEEEAGLGCWISRGDKNDWAVKTSGSAAYEGSRYVSLDGKGQGVGQPTQADLYYPVQLKAGMTYEFACYTKLNSYMEGFTLSAGYCDEVGARDVDVTNFIDKKPIVSTSYVKFKAIFTPETDMSFIRLRGITLGSGRSIWIDNVTVTPISCRYPENVTVLDLSDTEAEISWSRLMADRYNIKVSTKPLADPTTETADVCDNSTADASVTELHLTELKENTYHYVYLQSECGTDGKSMWTDAVSFRTSCAPVSGDFFEGFEDAMPLECWRWDDGNTVKRAGGQAHEGTAYCSMGAAGVATNLATPMLDVVTLKDKMLRMYAKSDGGSVSVTVGVATSPVSPMSVYPVSTTVLTKEEGWKEIVCYFSALDAPAAQMFAGAKHIVISANNMCYIDNISVTDIPACTRPANAHVTDLGDTYAEIDWMMYEEKPCSVTVRLGDEIIQSLYAPSHPLRIEKLVNNTEYTLEITAQCDGTESEAEHFSFTTECGVESFPYKYTFDDATTDAIPSCWADTAKSGPNPAALANKWKAKSGIVSGQCMQFNATYSNKTGNGSRLQTPVIDLTAVDKAALFFFTRTDSTAGKMSIVVSTDGGNTFPDTVMKDVAFSAWTNVQCDLTKYCGKEVTLGFHAVSVGNLSNEYIYIDDISVAEPRECDATATVAVTSVEGDKAYLTVTDSEGSAWEVVAGKVGFDPDTVKSPVVLPSKNGEIDGLPVAAQCEVYIRVKCEGGGHSAWSKPVKFISACAALSLPYSQDFESVETVADLVCYEAKGSNALSNLLGIVTATGEVVAGEKSVVFRNQSVDSYLLFPELDMELERLIMEFKYVSKQKDNSPFEIGVIHKDSIDEYQTNFISVAYVSYTTEFTTRALSFASANRKGKGYRVAMKIPKLVNYDSLTIDDIHIYEKAELFAPVDLVVNEITDNSALISWTAADGALYSEISVNGGTPIKVQDGAVSHRLTSLSANTDYSVKLRSTDADGNTTAWSHSVAFTTNGKAASLPYDTDFENEQSVQMESWKFSSEGGKLYWTVSDVDPDGVYEGSKALYVANGDDKHEYLESENYKTDNANAYLTLNLEEGTYSLSFMYHAALNDQKDYMRVVLISNSSTVNIEKGILWASNARNWTKCDKEFYVPEAGYYRLAFLWTNQCTQMFSVKSYLPGAIDNLKIDKVACPDILEIKGDSIGSTSAKVMWTDNYKDGTAYEYALLKGDEVFEEGKTLVVPATDGKDVFLRSLSENSDYKIMVRAKCSDTDVSGWSEYSFSTRCAPVTVNATTSHEDSFEDYKATDLGCWQHSSAFAGRWGEGSSVNSSVLPHHESKCIAIASYKKALISRAVDLKTGLNYQVQFVTRQSANVQNNTHVAVLLGGEFDDMATAQTVYDAQIYGEGYERHTARFNVPEDGVYTVGLLGETKGTAQWLALDSLIIKCVACDRPASISVSDITASSATVSWSGTADKYKFRLYRGDVEERNEEVTGNILPLTGLYGSSKYSVEISSVCPDGGESEAVEVLFATGCGGAAPAPYYESFDTENNLPQCWNNMSTQANWSYKQQDATDGALHFDSKNVARGSVGLIASPEINIAEAGYSLSLDYINPAGGPLSIHISTDGGETYDETIVAAATAVSDWRTVAFALDGYVGKNVTMVAEGESNYSARDDAYSYIDNFRVSKVAETKSFKDTLCYGEPYKENGFDTPSDGLTYGVNTLTRLAHGATAGEPDTLYEAAVYVPNTDKYITDIFIPGQRYTGNGFVNGIDRPGYGYTRTDVTDGGCQQTIHLTLLEMDVDVVIYDTICEGNDYPFCDELLTESCTKVCTKKNDYGIDSVTTLHLTVLPSLVERRDTICQGDFVEFGGEKKTTSDIYEADSTYSNGCTYKSRLILTVIDSLVVKDTTICQGRYVEIDGARYSTAGGHRITLKSESDCPRVMRLNLTVIPADTVTHHTVACEGKAIYFHGFAGEIATADTVMFRTDKSKVGGCDSVTRLIVEYHETVEVFDTVYTSEKVYACDNGETLVGTGDCESWGTTADGCDSIHHLHVDFVTAVDDASVNTNIVIAPNPVKVMVLSYVYGEWSESDVDGMILEIVDATGSLVYQGKVEGYPVVIDGLDVSGVYIVRITDKDGKVYVGRLVVL